MYESVTKGSDCWNWGFNRIQFFDTCVYNFFQSYKQKNRPQDSLINDLRASNIIVLILSFEACLGAPVISSS